MGDRESRGGGCLVPHTEKHRSGGSYLFRVWLPLVNNGRSGFNVTRELPTPEDGKRSLTIEVER